MALIRANMVRALALSAAAVAAALTPAACLGENRAPAPAAAPAPLPAKATQEVSAELLELFQQKHMAKHSPIILRVFKEESELEVWKQDASGHFQIVRTYPICRWSGDLGPKLHEGDRQAPEGFYTITPGQMNPNSNYYLAINVGFPNSFDKANERDGSFLMIHGDCASIGCYAMTDEQIADIYAMARDTFQGGRPSFQVQAYPFRLTPENLARHRTNPNMPFWLMLKEGNDHFLVSQLEPKVDVCERRYVFDAQPRGGVGALNFNPAGNCPDFVVNPKIARAALEKRRADEVAYAQLLRDNVPVAPIYSGLDGSMNEVFVGRFPGKIIPLAMVLPAAFYLPRQLPPVPWADNDGSVAARYFGALF